jgi:hypothetical protein
MLGTELAKAGIIVGYYFLGVLALVSIWLALKLAKG